MVPDVEELARRGEVRETEGDEGSEAVPIKSVDGGIFAGEADEVEELQRKLAQCLATCGKKAE